MPSGTTRCSLTYTEVFSAPCSVFMVLSDLGACSPKLLFPLKVAPKPGCTPFCTYRFLQTNPPPPRGTGENQIYHLVSQTGNLLELFSTWICIGITWRVLHTRVCVQSREFSPADVGCSLAHRVLQLPRAKRAAEDEDSSSVGSGDRGPWPRLA